MKKSWRMNDPFFGQSAIYRRKTLARFNVEEGFRPFVPPDVGRVIDPDSD
jgi:hypothetical protein